MNLESRKAGRGNESANVFLLSCVLNSSAAPCRNRNGSTLEDGTSGRPCAMRGTPHPGPLPQGEGVVNCALSFSTLWSPIQPTPSLHSSAKPVELESFSGRFPLPGGEGQGEGEPGIDSIRPQIRRRTASALNLESRKAGAGNAPVFGFLPSCFPNSISPS
jgi:hypothetical protein